MQSSSVSANVGDIAAALDATIDRARGSTLYAERLRGVRVRSLADLAALPVTTRTDLQRAGVHGVRALPLDQVCHYGESSGTSGSTNTVWLTAGDLDRNADAIRLAHPDVFAPGRVILNRFPFMAAPAHLMQRIAQRGAGIAVPAGNINWDVPFPRALELLERTGAHVLASLPMEPTVLEVLARARGLDPRQLTVDTLFLGGAPLPPVLARRLARAWGARVIELYGSTETMLLGTSCPEGTLHLEGTLAYSEILAVDRDVPADAGADGRLVVTTLQVEGSPVVRLDTGDVVRPLAPCPCGDPRRGIVVLGRSGDAIDLGGRRLMPFELIDAAAAAADALDSSVFFVVVLSDRVVVRIEARGASVEGARAFSARLPDVPVEIELVGECVLLDIETLSRSPHVYKPVVLSDWRKAGRRILTVMEGMIEWPRPTWAEGRRWLGRLLQNERRRRRLARPRSR